LDKDRRRQVEDWIRQQTAALEAFRHSLVPPQQEANLLQVPTIVPQNSLEQLWPDPSAANSQVGPIRSPTLWRRSRSESDVSAATSAAAGGNASGAGTPTPSKGRRQSHQTQQAPKLMVPLNEATHVCEHCGQVRILGWLPMLVKKLTVRSIFFPIISQWASIFQGILKG
jgi:hypothetical protein